MRRSLLTQLEHWRVSPTRKPLILQGARQVGKTWLLQTWGKEHFADVAYFNFEREPALKDLFKRDLIPERLIRELSLYRGATILPQQTLILFDEIQECESALTSLKYFREMAPQYTVASAGSLLGLKLGHGSFPVGQVDFLTLHPLHFAEFLDAQGKLPLLELIPKYLPRQPLPQPFHDELLAHFLSYLWVGGMPEAVKQYVSTQSFEETRRIQESILNAYLMDMVKHVPADLALKVRQVWESIPAQLSRENKKFQYAQVRPGARAKSHEVALQWLVDAGLLLRSHLVQKPGIPLKHYQNPDAFKLFPLDVGLLTSLLHVDSRTIVLGDSLYTHAKGAVAEAFVAQELTALGLGPLFYWTSGNEAEVDFLLEVAGTIIPVEVKAGAQSRSKSLSVYRNRHQPTKAILLSPRAANQRNELLELPLYALSTVHGFL